MYWLYLNAAKNEIEPPMRARLDVIVKFTKNRMTIVPMLNCIEIISLMVVSISKKNEGAAPIRKQFHHQL
jgi:hypothetical protein